MSVPAWVYKRMANGDISSREVEELEKFASSISSMGINGAIEVIRDKRNNLDEVMKSVDPKDRDDVLMALRQMKKQANHGCSPKESVKSRLKNINKTASFGQNVAMLTGAAVAPVVGHLAMRGIDAMGAKSQAQIQQDLQRILEVHPQIGRPQDPRVQMAYASLVRLNPKYAEDPLIAGPLLKQILDSRMDPTNPNSAPYLDPGIAKQLTEANKYVNESGGGYSLGSAMRTSLTNAIPNAISGMAGGE